MDTKYLGFCFVLFTNPSLWTFRLFSMFPFGKHSSGPSWKHGFMPLSFRGLVYLSVDFSSFQTLQFRSHRYYPGPSSSSHRNLGKLLPLFCIWNGNIHPITFSHTVSMERKQWMWTCFDNSLFHQCFVFSFSCTGCLIFVHETPFYPECSVNAQWVNRLWMASSSPFFFF